ncbi:FUSC family protein [Celerinatantimonas yamalensis]|uniref:FUSC family protein n=1 Tax=Celerinatantimonas yamalensis TaxID=559956 RepID=A0ABW9G3M9_9GAMM
MGTVLSYILMPDRRSVQFALKGVISMSLALTIAIALQLDRPYWAVISAVFLQIRPESGLVLEKSLCQICGTVVGGIVGIFILDAFMPYPYLALGTLTVWLGLNSALSAMVRRVNLIYAFAMAGVTAELIVLLVMVVPAQADSQTVFNVAQARVSEIIIGAICAAVVSNLFWPVKVKELLKTHANGAIHKTLAYLATELDPTGSHEDRHQQIDGILQMLTEVSDNCSAVNYEGPEGPGRARAANQICHKILSLLSSIQIFGRLQRRNAELITPGLAHVLEAMRQNFEQIASSTDLKQSYQLTKTFRHNLATYRTTHWCDTPLETRLLRVALEMTSDLTILLKAFLALENRDTTLLHASSMKPYRDPIIGLITGGRTALVFMIGTFIWIQTGAYAALMIMILPVIFSIMLARLPLMLNSIVLKRMLVGVVISIPVAIFYVAGLLAQSSGQLGELLLILSGPYFVGGLALANRPTLPYGLGFLISFTILVHVSTTMTKAFATDYTLSSALGILVAIGMLYWVFQMISGPSAQFMVKRLFQSTYQDLLQMNKQERPEAWFNRRMADRLIRLTNYDQRSKTRAVTDLALTGLNLGHISIRLQSLCQSYAQAPLQTLEHWQQALAESFLLATKGRYSTQLATANEALLNELSAILGESSQLAMIQGMFQRLTLTLQRSAQVMAKAIGD